jgi:hypothetical protein
LTVALLSTTQAFAAGTITVLWDANTEPDLAGYIVSYGNQPGTYTTNVDVGNQTLFPFSVPDNGLPYYFAVRAYDTSSLISPYSAEVAIRPPVLIDPPNQSGFVGAMVSLQLQATDADGDAITYGATGLPVGLTINANSGAISGVLPNAPGNYLVTASASDGLMTVFQTFTWTISTPPLTLTVNGVSPPATVTVSGGATVTVAVAGGPGQVGDWLGLYRVGGTVSQWLDWKYLNGTRTRPTTGLTAASVTFTLPGGSGSYQIRFFANDTATLLTTSSTIVSNTTTQLTVNGVSPPATVTVPGGTNVTVAVTAGPGQVGDWLGLYRVGATVSQWLDWKYLNGTRTRPTTGLTAATVTFTIPPGGGAYEIRFFENDTATLLVTSSTINSTVAPQLAVNGVNPPATVTVAGGAIVTVTMTGGPGQTGDWLGLYRVGATVSQWLDWKYLNGTRTRPTTGLGAATVTFTLPTGGGSYEIRFFSNDTATLLATSSTIISNTATQLTVNGVSPPATVSVSGGAVVTVAVTGGPGHIGDWLGLYRVGATPSQWLDWKYLNGTRTQPTTGLGAATVTFSLPAGSGNYEVRFYENDSVTLLRTSSTIIAGP